MTPMKGTGAPPESLLACTLQAEATTERVNGFGR